jgi:aminoglycoside phosphotransferase (APT) family kinase protein
MTHSQADQSSPGVDVPGLSAWLAIVAGLVAPLELTRIGFGQPNLTYLVTDTAGERVVVRRPPLGELARGAHDMTREHRILSALAGQPVPTPRPLAFSPGAEVTGAPVYVMEYVGGLVLHTNAAAGELSATARAKVGGEAAAGLAALHAGDCTTRGTA